MPTFILWRTFDPNLTDEDGEMLIARAVATAYWDPPFEWRRSFDIADTQPPQGFCVYEGPTKRDLHWQQRLCWLPFDEIREVEEVRAPFAGKGRDEVPDGWSLFLVERRLTLGATPATLCRENLALGPVSGASWVRSFFDRGRRMSACVFVGESADHVRRLIGDRQVDLIRVERLDQAHPSDWAYIFDRLSVPHYWER